MSDLGTPTPDLTLVKNACRVLESEGLDVHTITVMLYDGHWNVKVEATDKYLDDHAETFKMDAHGSKIERLARVDGVAAREL